MKSPGGLVGYSGCLVSSRSRVQIPPGAKLTKYEKEKIYTDFKYVL